MEDKKTVAVSKAFMEVTVMQAPPLLQMRGYLPAADVYTINSPLTSLPIHPACCMP